METIVTKIIVTQNKNKNYDVIIKINNVSL